MGLIAPQSPASLPADAALEPIVGDADEGKPYVAPPAPKAQQQPLTPQPERSPYFQQMKVRIHQQLVERLDVQNLKTLPPDVVRPARPDRPAGPSQHHP